MSQSFRRGRLDASRPERRRAAGILGLLGALALATPSAAGDDARYVNHVVQKGETLFSIAEKYYGDGYLWPKIHECNRYVDPEQLKVGQTLCVPNPTQGTGSGRGFLGWLAGGDDSEAGEASTPPRRAPPAKPKPAKAKTVTKNPEAQGSNGPWTAMFKDAFQVQVFGRPLMQVMLLVFGWFIIHTMVQGGFTWFAAHMAFVKDVSAKKAWRATVQSETLAALFLLIIGVAGLAVIYVSTAPPGKPVLSEILTIAEQYLSTPTGMAVSGLGVALLYVFLGVRFIPQTFGVNGGQGFAIVFLSVFLPHVTLLYLLGYRLGYF
jgi:LysM repeat protein